MGIIALFVFNIMLTDITHKEEPLTIGPDDIHAVSIAQSQELPVQKQTLLDMKN